MDDEVDGVSPDELVPEAEPEDDDDPDGLSVDLLVDALEPAGLSEVEDEAAGVSDDLGSSSAA